MGECSETDFHFSIIQNNNYDEFKKLKIKKKLKIVRIFCRDHFDVKTAPCFWYQDSLFAISPQTLIGFKNIVSNEGAKTWKFCWKITALTFVKTYHWSWSNPDKSYSWEKKEFQTFLSDFLTIAGFFLK